LVSPILSFTAEEIWQSEEHLLKKNASVFLTELKSFPTFTSNLNESQWQRLLLIKEQVNQAIEERRNVGEIKGSLDTEIDLEVGADDFMLLSQFLPELHFFFIISKCNLKQGTELHISVTQSNHEKCSRCWHRNETVGSVKAHPDLCKRCELNVEGSGEDRQFA